MKVLIVTPCGLPVPAVKGGAVLTLVESLIIQNEKKHKMELTVVGIHDGDAVVKSKCYKNTKFLFLKAPGVVLALDDIYEKILWKVLRHSYKNSKRYLFKLYAIKQIKRAMKAEDYDRVVFENAGYLLNVLRDKGLCEKYENHLYYHVHNDIPDNVYLEGMKRCRMLLISEYLKKKVLRMCGKDFAKNINILKNGFDQSAYGQNLSPAMIDELRRNIGIERGQKVILFAGRIDPTKGIEQVTAAFRGMNRNDVVLMVVGSHSFGAKRSSQFEEHMKKVFDELGARVKFTGYVPYSDMWKYYKIADVAVLPSIWEEPAGLTMIEAAAAGTPVITTYSGGIPEYLSNEFALLLPKDEHLTEMIQSAIEEVLSNEDEWKKRAEKAGKYVRQNFSEENFYRNFVNLIK